MDGVNPMRVFLLNTPDRDRLINRDMAGGLGFDRAASTILPPLDLLSYATTLVNKGFLVKILDSQVEPLTEDQIIAAVNDFLPDAVILTLSLPSIDADMAFAKRLKGRLAKPCQIIFKTGIPFAPIIEKILRESVCAYCITGECDLTIDQIVTGHTALGTARLVDGAFQEEKDPALKDLDELPILKRAFLHNDRYCYSRLGAKATTMQTSRGCPFSCGYYCPYPLVQGKKWRAMSAERIFAELKDIVEHQGVRKVFFRDATFTLDKKRTHDFCRLIMEHHLPVAWWCETRVDCLDDALLDVMKAAGCQGMNVGIETGDETLRTEMAKEGVTKEDIIHLTEYCKKIAMKLHYLLMVGLPGETRQTLYETFKLVDQVQPESIGITTATPYPGTPLYYDAIKNNWIVKSDLNAFGGHGYNMQINHLTQDDLQYAMDKIHEVSRVSRTTEDSDQQRRHELHEEFRRWIEMANVASASDVASTVRAE